MYIWMRRGQCERKTRTTQYRVSDRERERESKPIYVVDKARTLSAVRSRKRPELNSCWSGTERPGEQAAIYIYAIRSEELAQRRRQPLMASQLAEAALVLLQQWW